MNIFEISELNKLKFELDSELYSELDSELCSELWSELCSELDSELDSELSELYSELDSELAKKENNVGNMHINKICTYLNRCGQQLKTTSKVYCNDILPCSYWSESDN